MVRMPAFGLDGPWRNNVGFAQTMEQMTGMAWVTGHEYDQPRIPRGPCDPLAGMHSAFAMLAGLRRRDETGQGSLIEVSMVESALNAAAEQVVEFTAYGNLISRLGNRSRDAAPQGLYQCAGTERWLAISVATDEQWSLLKSALGEPDWANDPALDIHEGRVRAHDVIDKHLEQWAGHHDSSAAAELLVEYGVPAADLADARAGSMHPQLVARGFSKASTIPSWDGITCQRFRSSTAASTSGIGRRRRRWDRTTRASSATYSASTPHRLQRSQKRESSGPDRADWTER